MKSPGSNVSTPAAASGFNPFDRFAYKSPQQPVAKAIELSESEEEKAKPNAASDGNDSGGWMESRNSSKMTDFDKARNIQKAILAKRRREGYKEHKEQIKIRKREKKREDDEASNEEEEVSPVKPPLPDMRKICSSKSALVRDSLMDRSLDNYDPLDDHRSKTNPKARASVYSRIADKPAPRTDLKPFVPPTLQPSAPAQNTQRRSRVITCSDDEDDAVAVVDLMSSSSSLIDLCALEDTPERPRTKAKATAKVAAKPKKKVESESEVEDEVPSEEEEGEEEVLDGTQLMEKAKSIIRQCEGVSKRLQTAIGQWDTGNASKASDCINLTSMQRSSSSVLTNEDFLGICPQLKLNPYQLVGVNWLKLLYENDVNGVLADDMGLGKTVQTIAFLSWLSQSQRSAGLPHLVVVPASTLNNWKNELQKFNPDLELFIYHGTQAERADLRYELRNRIAAQEVDIILCTYTLFERETGKHDRHFLCHQEFDYLILDEAHCIKNADSSRYSNLNVIQTKHRLLLSGTPVQNNLTELLALLSFLMPDVFHHDKCQLIVQAFGWDAKNDKSNSSLNQMKSMLAPFVLRRLKVDVLDQLSSKSTVVHKLSMTPRQQLIYDNVISTYAQQKLRRNGKDINLSEVAQACANAVVDLTAPSPAPAPDTPSKHLGHLAHSQTVDLTEEDDVVIAESSVSVMLDHDDVMQTLTATEAKHLFTALRKAANHPLLLRIYYQDEAMLKEIAKVAHTHEHFGNQCNMERVLNEIKSFSDFDLHQLCVQYPAYLQKYELSAEALYDSPKMVYLREQLPLLQADGHRVLVFSQWTRIMDLLEVLLEDMGLAYLRLDGSTPVKVRQELIDTFNEDSSITIFLLSTKAGGLGINLTAADTVILHDLDFNPENDRQAEVSLFLACSFLFPSLHVLTHLLCAGSLSSDRADQACHCAQTRCNWHSG